MAQTTRELVLARRKAMSTSGKAGLPGGGSSNTPPVRASARLANSQPAATTAPAQVFSPAPTAGATYSPSNSSRAASLARRQAMSSRGKANLQSKDRTRSANMANAGTAVNPVSNSSSVSEKKDCGCGCGGEKTESNSQSATQTTSTISNGFAVNKPKISMPAARAASRARRQAMSSRGKAGISKGGMSPAQTARAGNPDMSSRELAKALREQRSKNGGSGQKQSRPCGHVRPAKAGETGAAQDAPWKVGASQTVQGQTVTGTMVGRSPDVTGDEASTCRAVTGTEYLGADIFREFCQTDATAATARKVTVTSTSHGNPVSGNRIGRGENVTGNEPGTCKLVTGDEYTSAEQQQGYCGEFAQQSPRKISMAETMKGKNVTGDNVGRSPKMTGDEAGMKRELTGTQYTAASDIGNAPVKVGISATLRGGNVTGTMVGRREKMTGDEAGSCRNVTGDDYIGKEQFNSFCESTPAPQDRKVGASPTNKGNTVTGTMTGRSGKVTGDEPGTCKSVTGTPYAGMDQAGAYCEAPALTEIEARTRPLASTPGPVLTGQQPGVGGVMTGADKGACEPLTGTPYVGADQFAGACPATAATTASPDFPQPIGGASWGQFSVAPPSGGAAHAEGSTGVTGNRYESRSDITGPFGMAGGKVTGTEQARFGRENILSSDMRPVVAEDYEGRIKSRITGEGQDAGLKITGDDWERGEHVTGTEGKSATRRNPTIRMGMANAMAVEPKRNEELPIPNSKVTGGSGNTDKGSLITYSGGARG
jgi:hypothetical protein